ncbi:hypothetical protein [Inquilinus sp. OTU3971]|uniref:hypothetical protein n=1 Tax=Inquilinus sp. OTU3971 TaxID=3043855 RepID=UPI00313E9EF1
MFKTILAGLDQFQAGQPHLGLSQIESALSGPSDALPADQRAILREMRRRVADLRAAIEAEDVPAILRLLPLMRARSNEAIRRGRAVKS